MGRAAILRGSMGLMLATVGGAASAIASPLARYVDHARVLVVSAASPDDPGLVRQDAAIGAETSGLTSRDVVVVRSIGAGPVDAAVRAAVRLPAGRFGVALVGKDGGVKLRRQAPVPMAELFRTIDAMPMRREEMLRTGLDGTGPG